MVPPRQVKDRGTVEKIFSVLEKYEIGYFFYIGGNDSMDAVAKLEAYRAAHPEKNPDRYALYRRTENHR